MDCDGGATSRAPEHATSRLIVEVSVRLTFTDCGRLTDMTHSHLQRFSPMPIAILLLGCLAALAPGTGNSSGNTVVYPKRDADSYILSHSRAFFSTNASLKDVESLRKTLDGDFLWVRRTGKEFVIRDARTIEEAQQLFEPLDQFDPDREALQVKQEQIGSVQSALDDEQEKLESELEALEDEGERRISESIRLTLQSRQAEVELEMLALRVRERELDADERVLDDRSVEIELKAEAALWKLVDQAITNGMGRSIGRE